jgi:hypothetical protein
MVTGNTNNFHDIYKTPKNPPIKQQQSTPQQQHQQHQQPQPQKTINRMDSPSSTQFLFRK